jgi:hypothetical protein
MKPFLAPYLMLALGRNNFKQEMEPELCKRAQFWISKELSSAKQERLTDSPSQPQEWLKTIILKFLESRLVTI